METLEPIAPLRFGTKNDFDLAIKELLWTKEISGKLEESDFESISIKYSFPKEFLKSGLEGLSQNDFVISKSKWFPIIYSWLKHWDFLEKEYLKLIIWHTRSIFVFFLGLVGIVVAFLYLTSFTIWFNLNILNSASVGIAIVLFGIPFLYHLYSKKEEWNERVVNQEDKIRKEGPKQMIEAVNRLIKRSKFLQVAMTSPKKALKFIYSNITQLTEVGLGKLEIDSDKSFKVPLFENPDLAYIERWKKILNLNALPE